MKKILALVLATVLLVFCLAGCGKFECGICGEEKGGMKHETEILGKEIVICDDCYEAIDEGFEDIGDSFDKLGDALEDLGDSIG